MDILRLLNDEPFIQDIEEFFLRNDFPYFKPHEKKSIRQSLENMVLDSYYGVYRDGVMIAYGMLRGMDEGYEIPMLGIGVDKSYQGKGIGKLLMHFLETQASLDGYYKIMLRVHRLNKDAFWFYYYLGYKSMGLYKGYYTMEKDL